jgi:protease I
MGIEGKVVAILLEQDFQDAEVIYPYFRLKEAGAEAWLVGAGKADAYKGKYGYPFTVRTSAVGLDPSGVEAVVIPGGWAPDFIRRHPAALVLVRSLFEQGKPVASICHGGWVLASAGVLRGRRCTSFFAIKDDMVNAGAEWVDAECVVDGNLITSRTPDDLPAFMRALLAQLAR